jgi:hypothetical protein
MRVMAVTRARLLLLLPLLTTPISNCCCITTTNTTATWTDSILTLAHLAHNLKHIRE